MKQYLQSTVQTDQWARLTGSREETMKQGYQKAAIVSFALTICLVWAGCSDKDIISSNGITGNVENFFPVNSGSIHAFSVSEPNGAVDTVSFEIGASIQFGSELAKEWIAVDQTGNKSTSFVTISPSAVVFYETATAPGETILALPLKAGASWSRYGDGSAVVTGGGSGNTLGGLITITNGKGQPSEIDSTYNGKVGGSLDVGKNFPTDGSSNLFVDGFETVLLSNGVTYDGAVKLRNGGLGGVNFYWFAPGTGLVKYVLRAQLDGSEAGATVGELIGITTP